MTTAYGSDAPNVKVEAGAPMNGQGLQIKPDPDNPASLPQADDDIYEDAGDVDFANADQSVHLTKIPKFLWELWSKLDDNQEIEVGKIRIEGPPNEPKRMSLLLDSRLANYRSMPREYNMHITNKDSANTFIFSEKDLPGFRQFSHDRAPPHWNDRKRVEKKKGRSNFRRAVPKQTALAGQVRTEINCLPVENADFQRMMDERARMAQRSKKTIQVINSNNNGNRTNALNPGQLGTPSDFRNFINTNGTQRAKKQILKATRIPENELLDIIYDCFKEYTYWPFKVLKDRVQQPESYLKDVLEKVAFQAKTGPHVMEWQLKPEFKLKTYEGIAPYEGAKDETAPNEGFFMGLDGADDLDEDEDNIDMEDVPLE